MCVCVYIYIYIYIYIYTYTHIRPAIIQTENKIKIIICVKII